MMKWWVLSGESKGETIGSDLDTNLYMGTPKKDPYLSYPLM